MAEALKGPTWALLPPSSLPEASFASRILGAITLNWEHPGALYFPKEYCALTKIQSEKIRIVQDVNFWSCYQKTESKEARFCLGKWCGATFGRDFSDKALRKSAQVRTVVLEQQDDIFDQLYSDTASIAGIRTLLDKANRDHMQNHGWVFMVVGVKVLFDAIIEQTNERERRKMIDLGIPLNAIVASTTGFFLPLEADPEATVVKKQGFTNEVKFVASEGRVVALQYRLVRQRSRIHMGLPPRRERIIYVGRYHEAPPAQGFYGQVPIEEHGATTPENTTREHTQTMFSLCTPAWTAILAPAAADETLDDSDDEDRSGRGIIAIW